MSNYPKPLAFVLDPEGTIGDQKPLAILAVIAAKASSDPVYLISTSWPTWIQSIKKLAKLFKVTKRLVFLLETPAGPTDYFIITEVILRSDAPSFGIALDFGDNAGHNRFTSAILSRHRTSTYFGSLFLPIVKKAPFWSPMTELVAFVQRFPKIVGIAGSLHPPVPFHEVKSWAKKHSDTWGVVLVGYDVVASKNILVVRNWIEYEDIVRVVDFWITNCGAGSVSVGLAAGVPQTCIRAKSRGMDKTFNKRILVDTCKVGPVYRDENTFEEVMTDLIENYDFYKRNAFLYKKQFTLETKQMYRNMVRFFRKLGRDGGFQSKVAQTQTIPSEYALSRQPTHNWETREEKEDELWNDAYDDESDFESDFSM